MLTEGIAQSDGQELSGNSGTRKQSVLRGVAGYIIVCEFCERLAYYGFSGPSSLIDSSVLFSLTLNALSLTGSLVLFFQNKLSMSNSDADVQYSAWAGMHTIARFLPVV
jgi:hypothetical protein